MPTTIADMITEITGIATSFVPVATAGLLIGTGAVVTVAVRFLRRVLKSTM